MPHTLMADPETSDPRLTEALSAIRDANFNPRMPSPWHIKVGKCNFFWTTGKITIDGEAKVGVKGVKEFINLLQSQHDADSRPEDTRFFNRPLLSETPLAIDVTIPKGRTSSERVLGSSGNAPVIFGTRVYRGADDIDTPF